ELGVFAAEQGVLADGRVSLQANVLVDGFIGDRGQRPAGVAQRIKGAGLDQGVQNALITDVRGHLVEEVPEICEATLVGTCLFDTRHDVIAHIAYRRKTESDVIADRGEIRGRIVDIGRQDV